MALYKKKNNYQVYITTTNTSIAYKIQLQA